MALVPSYASIRPDESGPHVGLTWTWVSCIEWLWFPQGPPLILVTVVLFYVSTGTSDFVPHLGCMALVTLVLTQALFGPGYSIPHLGLTLTTDLWSHFGPQIKLVTLVPFLGLTLTW